MINGTGISGLRSCVLGKVRRVEQGAAAPGDTGSGKERH